MPFKECLKKGKASREDADYYEDWSEVGSSEILKLVIVLRFGIMPMVRT